MGERFLYAAESAGGHGRLVHAVDPLDGWNSTITHDDRLYRAICGREVVIVEPHRPFADCGPVCSGCEQPVGNLPDDPFQEVIDLTGG